jgi:hypothetical protein
MPLHLAAYTGTPTVAILSPHNPSAPRHHWIESLGYHEAMTDAGRAKIVAAVQTALKGDVRPGRCLRKAEGSADSAIVPTRIAGADIPGLGKFLSILVPTLKTREKWLKRLLRDLLPQQMEFADEVEILIESDDGELSIGAKRNKLLDRAAGEWVVFHDDDDPPRPGYVRLILDAIKRHSPDCIGFRVGRSKTVGGQMTRCGEGTYSLKHPADDECRRGNTWAIYKKMPRHLTPMRTHIARQIRFLETGPEADRGEDVDFAKRLKAAGLLKSERFIDKELYVYELRGDNEREGEHTHAMRVAEGKK